MRKLFSPSSILILAFAAACGTNPAAEPTVAPASPVPAVVATQVVSSPTAEVPKVNHWTATADFGAFVFDIDASGQMVMGRFDFPNGFSCGSSKVSGTSLDVFHINTVFPEENPFGVAPQKEPPLPVAFPVNGETFAAGPFWIGTKTPVGNAPVALMQMTLEGRFDSDAEASGQYTAYFVRSPRGTDLADTPCTGAFSARMASATSMINTPTPLALVNEEATASASTTVPPTALATWPPATYPPAAGFQADQARSFAEPILRAIADRHPDFEDDFSTGRGSWNFGNKNDEAAIVDGAALLPVSEGDVSLSHDALTGKDFVLQADGRVVSGDPETNLIVHFHNRSSANWYYLSMNIGSLDWTVDKRLNNQQANLASGHGILSPLGEYTKIMIFARGTEGAIYLNGTPAAYFNDADFNIRGYTLLFCEARDPGHRGVCEFDNIKLWDLTGLSALP